MKLISSAVFRVALLSALALLAGTGSVRAQEDEPPDETATVTSPADSSDFTDDTSTAHGTVQPGEAVFREIELSPEGVVAFDSVGNRWYFDFEEDVFVLDTRSGGERVGSDWTDNPESAEPVEERCTEQLTVRHPELKAVFVGYDEFVDGDIIAYDRVTVKGWVKGSIQSFNKRVLVTSSGRVDGDIKAPEIEIKEGGEVLGRQVLTERYQIPPIDMVIAPFSSDGLWVVLTFTLSFLLIAFLTVSLAPRQVENVSQCIIEHKVKSYFAGLLFLVLLPLLIGLLAITIVGIVAILFLPLSILVAMVLGMAVCGRMLARGLLKDYFGQQQSLMFQALFGVLVFMLLWTVVAVLLGTGESSDVAHGFGIFMLVLSIVLTTYPFLAGMGAAFLTRFGFRQYVSFRDQMPEDRNEAPTPAPPPLSGAGPSAPPLRPGPRPPSFDRRSDPPNPASGD